MRLANYSSHEFDRGRPVLLELLWLCVQFVFVSSFIPGSTHRRFLLRLFGAQIGSGVIIKPHVKVKFPWRLTINDNSWVGENVWIDNLAEVKIGANTCVSQDTYFCTGSHNWNSRSFDLITKPISVGNSVWVSARSTIGPGVSIGNGAVLGLGSVATKDLVAWTIYSGVPAQPIKKRELDTS